MKHAERPGSGGRGAPCFSDAEESAESPTDNEIVDVQGAGPFCCWERPHPSRRETVGRHFSMPDGDRARQLRFVNQELKKKETNSLARLGSVGAAATNKPLPSNERARPSIFWIELKRPSEFPLWRTSPVCSDRQSNDMQHPPSVEGAARIISVRLPKGRVQRGLQQYQTVLITTCRVAYQQRFVPTSGRRHRTPLIARGDVPRLEAPGRSRAASSNPDHT